MTIYYTSGGIHIIHSVEGKLPLMPLEFGLTPTWTSVVLWRRRTGVTPNWLRNPILFTTDEGGGMWYVDTQRWERTSRWCACVWGWLLHGEWERRCAFVYVLCVERESEYIYTRYRKTTAGAGGRNPASTRGEHTARMYIM